MYLLKIDLLLYALINPNPNASWTFEITPNLGSSGLYDPEQLEDMTRTFLFPSEQQAITASIPDSIISGTVSSQGTPYYNFLSEDYITTKVKTAWEKATGYFQIFGLWAATWIGVISIFKMIIFALDSSVNMYSLYKIFLVAGFLTHLTHFIQGYG